MVQNFLYLQRWERLFLERKKDLQVSQVLEKRHQEIIYGTTKELIRYHFSDDDQQS